MHSVRFCVFGDGKRHLVRCFVILLQLPQVLIIAENQLLSVVRQELATGSIMNFILSAEGCLGPLTFLRIWHDNSGHGKLKGWFLDQIQITDLQTGEKYVRTTDRWILSRFVSISAKLL